MKEKKILDNVRNVFAVFGVIAIIVLVIAIVVTIKNTWGSPQETDTETETEQVSTVTESHLMKVIEKSDLSFTSYTYSAVATAYADDGETVMYYVAYEGNVKAGIDVEDIDIDITGDVITLTLPECEIQTLMVEFESMDYMFTDDKYESETVSTDAYALCEQDLEERVANEDHILEMAQVSAENAVEALMRPWIEQAYPDYTLKIQ